MCVCKQQRGRSGVSASCRALQQLHGWGFLPGGSRPQESEPPWGLSGMLLGQKDSCCVWVCSCLWIHFQWRRSGTWKYVPAFIPWPVYTVRITILPETHTKGKYFIMSVTQKKFNWFCPMLSIWRGPKYNLLAHTTLRIEHVQEGFKTHDLSLTAAGKYWLLSSSCLISSSLFLQFKYAVFPLLASPPENESLISYVSRG